MNELSHDLKNGMVPAYHVIREAVPDEQLDEYKKAHPAGKYVRVSRVGP
ncbi:MAG: hypothetical protein PHH09_09085 [Methanoregulaceae archaeon]|nr:hypothetical protein [Methanoregulaceae archaeon]